jgi:hypothetical protein
MTPDQPPLDRRAQYIGVGCLTTVAGGFSGAMVAVLIGKFIGFLQRCSPDVGLPACNWNIYAGVGALVGVVTLPTLVLWRLRQSHRDDQANTRG